jgi:hypothetical protein
VIGGRVRIELPVVSEALLAEGWGRAPRCAPIIRMRSFQKFIEKIKKAKLPEVAQIYKNTINMFYFHKCAKQSAQNNPGSYRRIECKKLWCKNNSQDG